MSQSSKCINSSNKRYAFVIWLEGPKIPGQCTCSKINQVCINAVILHCSFAKHLLQKHRIRKSPFYLSPLSSGLSCSTREHFEICNVYFLFRPYQVCLSPETNVQNLKLIYLHVVICVWPSFFSDLQTSLQNCVIQQTLVLT